MTQNIINNEAYDLLVNDFLSIDGLGSSPTNAESELFIKQGEVQTTDASETTLVSVSLAEEEMITIKGIVNGYISSRDAACGGDFLLVAQRPSGGNVTLVGTAITNINTDSTATFTVDVDTGTETVRIRVTGVAAETWDWVASYEYQKIV